MNPMLVNMLSGRLGPIKKMFSMVQAAQDPQAVINQLVQNNPQAQQALQLVQESGGDAKAAFYKLAKSTGIDPDQILQTSSASRTPGPSRAACSRLCRQRPGLNGKGEADASPDL